MKVFISWSGTRSKEVAYHVKQWVSQVFQGTIVFMSSQDIRAGTNWSERIKKELANTTVGIVCMTPENQDAKWINYEMGALSKEVNDGESRVIPLLIGFGGTHEVGQPAASLNMVMLGQAGFKAIATSLNDINEIKREKFELEMVSDLWWEKLGPLMEEAAKDVPEKEPAPPQERDMVEEILDTVRALRKSPENHPSPRQPIRDLAESLLIDDDTYKQLEGIRHASEVRRRKEALDYLRREGFDDAALWTRPDGTTVLKSTGDIPAKLRRTFLNMLRDTGIVPADLTFIDISAD